MKRKSTAKSVKIVDHNETEVIACKKYPLTMPYSKVVADFTAAYANKAFDFKLVAKDDFQNWFFVIVANKKYEISREEMVVPIDYALMHLIAQHGETAVVLIPYSESSVIGVVKDKEVIYAQQFNFSIYSGRLDSLSFAISSVLDEMKVSKVIPDVSYIVNPPQTVAKSVLDMFQSFELPAEVIPENILNPLSYKGDLSLNPAYAFRNRKSLSNFLFTMQQNQRQIITTVLSFLVVFLWTYVPAHAVINTVNHTYSNSVYKMEQTLSEIQNKKKIFGDILDNLEKKKMAIDNYNVAFQQINQNTDIVPAFQTILSYPSLISLEYSGDGFSITFTATTTDIDTYFNMLLRSGYFNSIQVVSRINKPATYTVKVGVKK